METCNHGKRIKDSARNYKFEKSAHTLLMSRNSCSQSSFHVQTVIGVTNSILQNVVHKNYANNLTIQSSLITSHLVFGKGKYHSLHNMPLQAQRGTVEAQLYPCLNLAQGEGVWLMSCPASYHQEGENLPSVQEA